MTGCFFSTILSDSLFHGDYRNLLSVETTCLIVIP